MNEERRKSWLPLGMVPGATPSAPADAVGVEEAWERFRAEAAAVDPRDVTTFTHNTAVVLHNVRTGVAAVLAERAWFEAQQADGLRVDFERVAAAEGAAEALEFAAARAAAPARVPGTLRVKIKRSRVILDVLRASADLLVKGGVLSAADVPAAVENGPRGVARACVRYAALFRANRQQIRGATTVSSALVKEAATLGSELLREVKPRGVAKASARTEAERAASADRDRMAVVTTRRYDYVERVAVWRWGRDCEAFVPRMLTRDTSRSEADDEDVTDDADEDTTDTAVEETADEKDTTDTTAADDDADEGEDSEVTEEPVVVAEKPAAKKTAAPTKKPAAKGAPTEKPAAKRKARAR
jgi:hypothetical protein